MKIETMKIENHPDDNVFCYELTDQEIEGHHYLSDLAKAEGHASLRSCLNDGDHWGRTVAEVADFLTPEP
jgi:hypothetical protein